jgi:hypothetical protein
MSFNDYISRSDAAATLPEELASELVQGMAKSSAALALGHSVPMTVLENMLPAEATLPTAYWNVPDGQPSSLAQTTDMQLSLNQIIAYELDTLVVIPQNVLDDSTVPLWDVVRPRVSEAMAKQLDNAAIWGVGQPSGSNLSVLGFIAANSGGRLATGDGTTASSTTVTDANASSADVGLTVSGPGIPSGTTVASVSAGVHLVLSAEATATASGINLLLLPADPAYIIGADVFASGHDSAADVLSAAGLVAQCSYNPSAAWVAPGWQFRNMAARTQQLVANPVGNDALPLMLGGLPISPCAGSRAGDAGAGTGPVWNAFADAIVGDWSALKIGVRKDITMTTHTEGIISDSNGVVQYNLMQAGGVALKAVARYSWVILQPPVADDSFIGQRSVFAAVQNTGTAGRVGGPLRSSGVKFPLTTPLPPTKR